MKKLKLNWKQNEEGHYSIEANKQVFCAMCKQPFDELDTCYFCPANNNPRKRNYLVCFQCGQSSYSFDVCGSSLFDEHIHYLGSLKINRKPKGEGLK